MRVTALVAPYNGVHDHYTAYYREGLARVAASLTERGGGPFPDALRWLSRARDSYSASKRLGRFAWAYQQSFDAIAAALGGRPGPEFEEAVARFVFRRDDGSETRVCVDARDSGELLSPRGLEWCHHYFKTSYLAGFSYPEKVLPLWQCSFVLLAQIDRFRSLRSTVKQYDVCFTTRVWGGTNDVEGIEHNLRILEALSKVNCRKYLRAYLLAGDREGAARRLEARGIPWSMDPLPFDEHLRVLAASRLNVHRLGMHNSITWRMSELICLGACPVMDQPPRTLWPVPLSREENYLSLDAVPDPGTFLASDEAYAAIPGKVEAMLASPALVDRVAAANARYFDEHLHPAAVGRYLLDRTATAPGR